MNHRHCPNWKLRHHLQFRRAFGCLLFYFYYFYVNIGVAWEGEYSISCFGQKVWSRARLADVFPTPLDFLALSVRLYTDISLRLCST